MKTALKIIFALLIASCALPILGGPTESNTKYTCWDGTKCEMWQSCPAYAAPGKCVYEGGDQTPWSGQ